MKKIVMAACVAALAFVGCKKDNGGGGGTTPAPGTGAMGNAGAGTTGTTPPAGDAPKNPAGCNSALTESIVADYTLTEKCSPYTPAGDLNVDGFALTIEPGVEIKFADNATFSVGYYKPGRVLVKGTKEKPVKFTGRTWKGLYAPSNAAGSSLENVVFENAGTEDAAAIKAETFDLVLNGVTITGAKKTALDLRPDRALKGFTGVDLTKASADPSELVHANFATASVFTPAGLTVPEKALIWLHAAIDSDVTLTHAGATYRVPDEANVDPQEGKTASLTIKEGVTIELGENAGLNFGYYRGPAGLKIQGTKEKPVTVTRFGEDKATTPSHGIQLFAGARAPEIDFLVLEYAGGTDKGALLESDTRGLGKITNSVFRHLKGEGVRVDSSKDRFVAFDGNTFEDVDDSALRVPLELAHNLGTTNTFTSKSRVTLFGETKKDTTLENIGAPYVVEGELNVNGDETKSVTLTVNPGVSMLFNDQGKLSIAYYAPAKIVAKGTAEKPVTFGKLLTSWNGLGVFGKGGVELENVAINGTADDSWPLDLSGEVTGSVKKVALKDTKKGVHGCAAKVKVEGVTADKGVKAVEKCE
jgi:hypothetical protein